MKTALVTGVTGQDGAYLAKLLLEKNYNVYGLYRRLSTSNFWRIEELGIKDKVKLVSADMTDSASIHKALLEVQPNEVYNLAAQSHVGVSFDQPLVTMNVTGLGIVRLIDAIKSLKIDCKVYQASSSEMFGNTNEEPQNEQTKFMPVSPYGASKVYAYWITDQYRKGYGIHASNGILFNHESEMRGVEFVTRRITQGIARIVCGLQDKLILGNLDAKRDWGYAPEYVECMWRMLQQEKPDDYVIATNETHTIREFVAETCRIADVSEDKIISSKNRFRPVDLRTLRGDYSKAERVLKWTPKIKFKELVKIMIGSDIRRILKNGN